MTTFLEQAILTATQAHDGQLDSDGTPHIMHSLGVMFAVLKEIEGMTDHQIEREYRATRTELLIAAVLHDVVEDTPWTLDRIRLAFGQCVADIVDGVTRREVDGEKETYRDFIYRSKQHPGARLVKVCDLLNNIGRLPKLKVANPRWHDKLDYKYHIALKVLNDTDEPTWEEASWQGKREKDDAMHYYVADPNGKRIETTVEAIQEYSKARDKARAAKSPDQQ
jgi:(p)ppGpp synthase/HD superfamily hydrolase